MTNNKDKCYTLKSFELLISFDTVQICLEEKK